MKLEIAAEDIPASVFERAITEAAKAAFAAERLLDAKEAAALLSLPEAAFRTLAREKGIGSFDFGARRARWSFEQLRVLKTAFEVKGTPGKS